MAERYVVVDGSNIATEGRSIPSLAQLDEAVRAFMLERPAEQVIVVVDASFGYRIDESERAEYEQAEAAGEIVSPPAGAVGRGDGFLLRIADRTDAVVLSNDSFQEFHAEYPWLFDEGRLIGGKPVPGVGWIFTPRSPVRGPKSREAIRQARKAQKAALKRATVAEGPVAEAIAEATAEAIHPDDMPPPRAARRVPDADPDADDGDAPAGKRARRRRSKPVGAVNDPLPFIQFIADHPLGTEVEGEVDGFTSHGAFVMVGAARCYVPLVALGTPPPRSAKSVLTKGEVRTFVVQALDPPRRGIELGMPGVARVAGVPTEETVEADIGAGRRTRRREPEKLVEVVAAADTGPAEAVEPPPAKRRTRKKAAAPVEEAAPATAAAVAEPRPEPEPEAPAKRARRSRKAAVEAVVVEAAPEPAAAPSPAPAKRARKAKAPAEPAAEEAPAPARARRSRKAAAAEVAGPEPQPQAEPAPTKARRPRKAAAVAEPEPAPAPEEVPVKKASRKRAAAKKVAAPGAAAEVAPAEPAAEPVKKARRPRKAAPAEL